MIGLRTTRRRKGPAAPLADPFSFSVSGGRSAPADARHALSEVLAGKVEESALANCTLLLSEIVTNCVLHGGATESETIDVTGAASASVIRVEVVGAGAPFEHEPTLADGESVAGRGLFLVDALAARWGNTARAGRAEVWFEVAKAG